MGAHIEPPPADRYCDLVMKGGITSGVVYPRAIVELSKHYRFKNIGGTSVGAIAAAITAAAEYRRRNTRDKHDTAGFDLLDKLPDELQKKVSGNRGKLLSLFQAKPGGCERLFKVLTTALNSEGTWKRVRNIAWGLVKAYRLPAATAAVIALALGTLYLGDHWALIAIVVLLAFVVALVPFLVYAVYGDLTTDVEDNGFGLCTGMDTNSPEEALTPWLHRQIQEAAGKPSNKPLTFGDLWCADPDYPPEWLVLPKGAPKRAIDLQMFSTNLTHGRPYVFPLTDGIECEPEKPATAGEAKDSAAAKSRFRSRDRLYFTRKDLEKYLPPDVMKWVMDHSSEYKVEEGREGRDPDPCPGIRELPPAREFPVLLAARMSLSFPLLFSAIPLYAVDHDAPRGKRTFKRCWFSDGGISSNFPMHLFDGLVPMWPTFGLDLESEIPHRPPVYLPTRYDAGYGERWNTFADKQVSSSRFGGFLLAIVGAMQNWNDNMLARMPGVRDRVARVRLSAQEGGLNLDMEAHHIDMLAGKGQCAATKLLEQFASPTPGNGQAQGWDAHRLVRLNVFLKMVEARGPAVTNALHAKCDYVTPFSVLIEKAVGVKDLAGYERPMTREEKDALAGAIEALTKQMNELSAFGNPFRAVPNPELRVRPPL